MANETQGTNLTGAFDAHHTPSLDLMEKCVHCGFCLPACPTYTLWGQEMDSPRGRIYLMKLALEGKAEMNKSWVSHFDSCLGCVACMPACPSGVDYGKLIEATRAQIERNYQRPAAEKLHRRFLFETFTKPGRMRLLRWPLLAYQKSGVQAALRTLGVFKALPKTVAAMEALLPTASPIEPVANITPAQGEQRKRVGLLLGCVQRTFFSHVNAATARVLAAEGCEVVAPPEQTCCGALFVHAGEEEQAQELARKTIEVFEQADVETIVINAAGCGSNVKEYGHLLRDDPEYADRAKHFAAKCRDISEVLVGLSPRAERKALKSRVAFHDSCHLQHAQGVRAQPRTLLQQIPGVQLLEIPESPICCGSAGIYNLVQPEAASELGDRKARLIAPLQPDVVVTGNPGCLLQLQAALAKANHPIPVLHTIQLLDASIRGLSLDSLG
ncbi:MAG TPA: glycolate oxidase subunit GlcF [Candidatus Limnocylindrales bacterium]|nr:glycolate oxidase subunit GlcF [Candidatus Limnocylindrales bacterium]